MIPIDPIALLFLSIETPERAATMSGVGIYDPPQREGDGFGQKVLRAFRAAAVYPPFERRPTWIRHGLPAWEIVEPDLSHHVRHVALPARGRSTSCSRWWGCCTRRCWTGTFRSGSATSSTGSRAGAWPS